MPKYARPYHHLQLSMLRTHVDCLGEFNVGHFGQDCNKLNFSTGFEEIQRGKVHCWVDDGGTNGLDLWHISCPVHDLKFRTRNLCV